MNRIVATSDWHIGALMASAGRSAQRFREAKFETARRIVALVAERDAAALFLLGDTFDSDRVGEADIRRTAAILGECAAPVFVLPGNHDWWHEGGALFAFAREAGKRDGIRVLLEEEPLTLPGLDDVTFYPCPVRKHGGVEDPTAWIPPRDEAESLRVGLIHGGLELVSDWEGNVPDRVAEARDLDLALLGDWHRPSDGPDGRTHYAGSPEPGEFGEEHEGQVLAVSLDGGEARVERVPVGTLAFRQLDVTLSSTRLGGAGAATLSAAVEGLGPASPSTAVRIRLSGSLAGEELTELERRVGDLADEGWAECAVEWNVEPLGEPDLAAFEEGALRAVADRIWASESRETVRRRALRILADRAETVR